MGQIKALGPEGLEKVWGKIINILELDVMYEVTEDQITECFNSVFTKLDGED